MDEEQMQTELLRALHRFRKFQFCALLAGLTRAEFFTLHLVQAHSIAHPDDKGMYVSALAGQLRVSSPAVSRMLKGLELRGLLERTVDRDDRRTTYIVLTDKGANAHRAAETAMRAFTRRVIVRMGAENMETLLTQWNRLADVMADTLTDTHTDGQISEGDKVC